MGWEMKTRTTDAQFAILLEFMERHGDIGKVKTGPQSRLMAEELWVKLSDALNVVDGGVKRTPNKWKRIWADWKSKTKQKVKAKTQNYKKPLTISEKRVAAVLKRTGISGQGMNRIPKLEPESSNKEIDLVLINDDNVCEIPQASAQPQASTKQEKRSSSSSSSTSSESDIESSPFTNGPSDLNSRRPSINSTTQERIRPDFSARIPRNQARFSNPSRRSSSSFQKAVREFASIERTRLDLEARRIEVERDRNELLHKIIDISQTFVEAYINRNL